MANVRIGVINWDCSLPKDTYFGYYQTRTLSPRKYRGATPYYANIVSEDKIEYHLRDVEEFEAELGYAIEAGIDYFAYVVYPEEGSRTHISTGDGDCSSHVYELNHARKMHEKSPLRERIGIAAIVGAHPFADSDIIKLVTLLGQPYYERIDGRALVYLYGGARADIIERINDRCREVGEALPFYVAMRNEGSEEENAHLVDAMSAYTCIGCGISTYDELASEVMRQNKTRLGRCAYTIPLYSVGWDPSPRIDIPSPWVTYPDVDYARFASEEELLCAARRLGEWISGEACDEFAGHILTFAWNEFEEGGWICPTYNADLSVNRERVDIFRKISTLWREML